MSLNTKQGLKTKKTKPTKIGLLGKYPGRTLHRLGAVLAGMWIASSVLNAIWKLPDQVAPKNRFHTTSSNKNLVLKDTATILIIETPSARRENQINTSPPRENKHRWFRFYILEFSPKRTIKITAFPSQFKAMLPGNSKPIDFNDIYKQGGVSLARDVIEEVLSLPKEKIPKRYLILSQNVLKTLTTQLQSIQIPSSKSDLSEKRYQTQRSENEFRYITMSKKEILNKDLEIFFTEIRQKWNLIDASKLANYFLSQIKTNITKSELIAIFDILFNSKATPIYREITVTSEE